MVIDLFDLGKEPSALHHLDEEELACELRIPTALEQKLEGFGWDLSQAGANSTSNRAVAESALRVGIFAQRQWLARRWMTPGPEYTCDASHR